MSRHLTPIDISNIPELVRIAEEVASTNTPRELIRDRKPVAIVTPMSQAKPQKKRAKTQADYEAFRSSAGSWKDVDVEQFKAEMYASRRLSTRPPVKL